MPFSDDVKGLKRKSREKAEPDSNKQKNPRINLFLELSKNTGLIFMFVVITLGSTGLAWTLGLPSQKFTDMNCS